MNKQTKTIFLFIMCSILISWTPIPRAGTTETTTDQLKQVMGDSIASSTLITIPSKGNVFKITGNSVINIINPPNGYKAGLQVTLWFQDAAVLKDGVGNLALGEDFIGAYNKTFTIFIGNDGKWYPITYASTTTTGGTGSISSTADVPDSFDRRYVTDLQKLILSSTSGTNTGDETEATIKSKLSITTISGYNTGDETTSSIKSKLGAGSSSSDGYITKEDHASFSAGIMQRWAAMGGVMPIKCPPSQAVLDEALALGFDQDHLFCVVMPEMHRITGKSLLTGLGFLATEGGTVFSQNGTASLYGIGQQAQLGYLDTVTSSIFNGTASLSSKLLSSALSSVNAYTTSTGNGQTFLVGMSHTGSLGILYTQSSGSITLSSLDMTSSLGLISYSSSSSVVSGQSGTASLYGKMLTSSRGWLAPYGNFDLTTFETGTGSWTPSGGATVNQWALGFSYPSGDYDWQVNTGYTDGSDIYTGYGRITRTMDTRTGTMSVWVYFDATGYSETVSIHAGGATTTATSFTDGWNNVTHNFTGANGDTVWVQIDNSDTGTWVGGRLDYISIPIP